MCMCMNVNVQSYIIYVCIKYAKCHCFMPFREYYWYTHSVSHFDVCTYFVHCMKRIRVREIIVALWMRKEIGKTTGKSRQSLEETMSSEWHVHLTHSVLRNCVCEKICVINYVVNYQVLWSQSNALIILSQKLVQFEWTWKRIFLCLSLYNI